MFRGLVLLLAVAVLLLGCVAGRNGGHPKPTPPKPTPPKPTPPKPTPPPDKCPEGSFTSRDECYASCSKDYSQYEKCQACTPFKFYVGKKECWKCVCTAAVFSDPTKECCNPKSKYPCKPETECVKYTCVPYPGSKYYYCKKELKVTVVGFAAKKTCTDCPDNVICCVPGKPYPTCADKDKKCNQDTYICEDK